MPEAVIYPPSIKNDKDKLFACYSLVQQMIDEHNRQSAASKDAGKFREYVKKEFDPRLKQVLAERNRLMEKIRWDNYTLEQWKQVSKLLPEEYQTIHESLFGNKVTEKTKPTLATSPALDELKAIDITKLSSLEGADPTEDFTTYTELDADSYISKTSSRVTWASLDRDVDVYVYKDKTSAHFNGNFEHKATVTATAGQRWGCIAVYALANLIDDVKGIQDASGDTLIVVLYNANVSKYTPCLYEIVAGTAYSDTGTELDINVIRYLTVERDESVGSFGTLYCYVYSDASRETLVETLSLVLHEKEDFQYIYAGQSYNDATTGKAQSGYIEDLDLQEGVTHEGSATLSGAGTLAAIAQNICYASATLAGVGTLAGIGQNILAGSVTLSGTGSISCSGTVVAPSQTFYPLTPVKVTPGTINSWVDVDVSSHVPSGATGVLLHLVNNWVSSNDMGVRKNGSSDNRHPNLRAYCHCWAAIGVDANRIFEAYIGAYSPNLEIWLVGYTKDGVTFFDNGYDKSLGTPYVWTDIDCSTECPNAIGLIFEVHPVTQSSFGFRKNGSADNRWEGVLGHNSHTVIIGCDASQICEGRIGSTDCDFYLIGYITAGATFNTNATDLSLGTVDTWLDLASLPSGAVMGFIEVFNTPATANQYGLRKNGSSENIYRKGVFYPWAFVECDTAGLIEGKIEDTGIDFFLIGYATTNIKLGGASLTGTGSLTCVGSVPTLHQATATLSGTGTLAGIAHLIAIGQATLAGTGSLSGIGQRLCYGAATLSGQGSLAGIGQRITYGIATLSGQGTLAAIGVSTLIGQAELSGSGSLAGKAVLIVVGGATLSGEGTLSAIGYVGGIQLASATLSGEGTLSAIGQGIFIGKSTLEGVGTLAAVGQRITYGVATLSGVGSLVAAGGILKLGSATLSGTGSLAAAAICIFIGQATLTGAGFLAAMGNTGRLLTAIVVTSQYRLIKSATSQYRETESVTAQKRVIESLLSGG